MPTGVIRRDPKQPYRDGQLSVHIRSRASRYHLRLGRQRRRLSLYIMFAPLCGNGRGLETVRQYLGFVFGPSF